MQQVLSEICIIIVGLTGATRVTVNTFIKKQKRFEVIGSSIPIAAGLEQRFAIPPMLPKAAISLVRNVRTDSQFKNHPLLQVFPRAKSLAAYLLIDDEESQTTLTIWNPLSSFFSSDLLLVTMERFAEVLHQIISDHTAGNHLVETVPTGLSEAKPPYSGTALTSFLAATLISKQRLLARGGASYLALRQWRKDVKPYQLEALTAIKANPGDALEDLVAGEIKVAVVKVYGKLFDCVVPIPGGSSGVERSFSVRVAEKVASLLDIPLVLALKAKPVASGKSHPAKSAALQPFELLNPPKGNVLIIDDVASSGKHIELATIALRQATNYCTTVVWVAD